MPDPVIVIHAEPLPNEDPDRCWRDLGRWGVQPCDEPADGPSGLCADHATELRETTHG
jgi:hypothetical protein